MNSIKLIINKSMDRIQLPIIFFVGCLLLHSCKKLVEVPAPVTSVNAENVFTNDATAASVLTGIYTNLSSNNVFNGDPTSLFFYTGLSSDELKLILTANQNLLNFYSNSLNADLNGQSWNTIYPIIFVINAALEGLSASQSLTPEVKKQLLGEATFLRAYCYFYLVNLYGDVPLVLTTDYKLNSTIGRTKTNIVYDQIVDDLKMAISNLRPEYMAANVLSVSIERVRPNKWTATALLARTYLYTKNYQGALEQSGYVLNQINTYNLVNVPLSNVFLKDSREAIWQIPPVDGNNSTKEGRALLLPQNGLNQDGYVLSEYLLNSFESGDHRKSVWVNSRTVGNDQFFYAYKYRDGLEYIPKPNEYSVVFRLAEQYLIRAEANAWLNHLNASAEDLNVIRVRAGLDPIFPANQSAMLTAIMRERRVEFFSEGHRWLDLKRTSTANEVLGPIKGSTWSPDAQLYPIPRTDIDRNPALKGMQNPGYR